MKAAPLLAALLLAPATPALAQDAGGTYVNIGEYTDDGFIQSAPVETVPLGTYETVPVETVPLPLYEVAPVAVTPETYAAPVVYSDVPLYDPPLDSSAAPITTLPYQAPTAFAAPDLGDGAYEAARLAAYDTNRDGTVTTAEAIATLRPLTGQ